MPSAARPSLRQGPHVTLPAGHRQDRVTFLAVAVLVLCAALWSLNGPLIKHLGAAGISGPAIASYRSLLGGLFLLPFALRHRRTLRRAPTVWLAAAVAMFALLSVTFVTATTITQAANAIVLQYTSPLWVFALSPLILHDRPRWSEVGVLALALLGVGVIFFGQPPGSAAGLAIALVSGFGYGALTVVLRRVRDAHPLPVAAMNCLCSGALLLPIAALAGPLAAPRDEWGWLAFMGVVQFGAPYALFSWALRHVRAHHASLIVLLETVLNPVWTWLLIGEAIPRATLLGGPLILVSVAAWTVLHARSGRAPP